MLTCDVGAKMDCKCCERSIELPKSLVVELSVPFSLLFWFWWLAFVDDRFIWLPLFCTGNLNTNSESLFSHSFNLDFNPSTFTIDPLKMTIILCYKTIIGENINGTLNPFRFLIFARPAKPPLSISVVCDLVKVRPSEMDLFGDGRPIW